MNFLSLPTDLIILILRHVELSSLYRLSLTCSVLRLFVEQHGWNHFLLFHPRSSQSLSKVQHTSWSAKQTLQHDALACRNWIDHKFIARPLADRWHSKLHPIIALNKHNLFVAAGNVIEIFDFTTNGTVVFRGYCSLAEGSKGDVTALSVGGDATWGPILVGFARGSVEEVTLLESTGSTIHCIRSVLTDLAGGEPPSECVQTVASIPKTKATLVLAADGTATIASGSGTSSTLNLFSRSWVAHVSGSMGFVAFGASSRTPLTIHTITPTGFTEHPATTLVALRNKSTTAVYAIAPFPGYGSDQVVISGWYDGVVRVHDIRSNIKIDLDNGVSGLRPVLSMTDPWSPLPIYSLATSRDSSQVAVGMAQHALVAFWDVRYQAINTLKAGRGWSMHAPENDPSPVYSLHLDGSSRLFGVTQSRPFVLDFGPDIKQSTYPPLGLTGRHPFRVRNDNLIEQDAGFYVTKYDHPVRVVNSNKLGSVLKR